MATIYSMTGFAVHTVNVDDSEVTCEIRSLNSRYLEIFVKLPQALRVLEDNIKDRVRSRVSRGKISCVITTSSLIPAIQNLNIDSQTVELYTKLLDDIRKVAGIHEPIKLEHLLQFSEIFSFEENSEIDEAFQNAILEVVDTTLTILNESRAREGANLVEDLLSRLKKIEQVVEELKPLAQQNPRVEFEKLYQRLQNLIQEQKIDRERLEQEVAIIADRVDITEELVRLESHIQLFRDTVANGSPAGKKLNFILQEMHREANTISSKNTMVEISHRAVILKEEIEKIREQVQNIE